MAINTSQSNTRGYSLIEMLVYVTLLAVIFLLVMNTVLSFSKSYRDVAALRAADHAGIDAMERMTREIRASSDGSISSGALTLSTSATTTRFYVQNNFVQMDINGAYYGPLTGSSTSVTNLTFTRIATTTSIAIKIDLTVNGISGAMTKTKQFHSTVVLKGI